MHVTLYYHAALFALLQEVYSRPDMAGSFDAVVTCFFIDTAHNILEYLEVIHRCEARQG
jgi:hypothetical protein